MFGFFFSERYYSYKIKEFIGFFLRCWLYFFINLIIVFQSEFVLNSGSVLFFELMTRVVAFLLMSEEGPFALFHASLLPYRV